MEQEAYFGEFQHGHMEKVGYDTYCKLLDEVVKEMQGIEIEEYIDVQIDINVSSYIPDEYIESSTQKIEVYQDIALCKTEEDISEIIDEITDRYGNMPDEVNNLIEITRIKQMCKIANIIKVNQRRENVVFTFNEKEFNIDIVQKLLQKFRNQIKFSPGAVPYITYKIKNLSDTIKEIKEFLEACK